MTRIQLLERQNKDLKIKNENLQNKVKFLEEQRAEDAKKIDNLNKKIDFLFAELAKTNAKIVELTEENKALKAENKQLKADLEVANQTIENLKTRLNKDSTNSSKPSSTDGYKKIIHNSREKTNKKVGGQNGHKGNTRKIFDNPTKITDIKKPNCHCGGCLTYDGDFIEKQLVDLKIFLEVLAYRMHKGKCDKCGNVYYNRAPEGIVNPVQYGDTLKAFSAILSNEGMISINKIADIINSLSCGILDISEGTIVNFNKELANKCEPIIESIKDRLIKSAVLHVDESGIRINGKLNWIHTACTEDTTLYVIDKKRGKEATDNIDILSYFVGILIHDHLKSYYKYTTMDHAECNAHILRYLKGVIEVFKRTEAETLLAYFVQLNKEKKDFIAQGYNSFSTKKLQEIEKEYLVILNKWKEKFELETQNKKNKKYYTDERCLITRLLEYKDEHLRFVKNFNVPFDNNMAERALRMIKTKIKVSGGFRSENGGNYFSAIRSLIDTAKKRCLNIFQTILEVFKGSTEIISQ